MTTAGADLRWLRAAVVAAVATSLGVTAHVFAGGLLPSWAALVAILAGLLVVSAAALGRPASYAVIAGLVAGGQTVVHLLLTATSGHGPPHAPSASPPVSPVSPVTTADVAGGFARQIREVPAGVNVGEGGTPHWVQHLLDDMSGTNALMAMAHLLAAALVSVWLWKGEQAVWGLVALLGAQVRTRIDKARPVSLARVAAAPQPPRAVTTYAVSHVRAQRSPILGSTSRRGPPVRRMNALLTSPTV